MNLRNIGPMAVTAFDQEGKILFSVSRRWDGGFSHMFAELANIVEVPNIATIELRLRQDTVFTIRWAAR